MKKSFVIALIAFQLILLSMIAGRYHFVLLTGTPLKVQVQAVDPMDYFRGQYVALAYPISTWTGAIADGVAPGTRLYLSLAVTSTGMVDKVTKVSTSRDECADVCIAAKLNHTEIRQNYSIKYTTQSGTGVAKEQTGEYAQVQYQYPYSARGQEYPYDWLKEGDKVEVGTYNGAITYVSKATVGAESADAVRPFPESKVYSANANGQVVKMLSKETVSTFDFDASRFYVREGTGLSVERLIRDSKVYANLRVGSDGKSVVESLEYEGSIIK